MRYRLALAFLLTVTLLVSLTPPTSTGLAAPAAADQASGQYVGMWTTGSAAQAAQLGQLGIGWTRTVAVWSSIEPSDNNFNFSNLDSEISNASGGGQRRVLVMIRSNPAWAAASRCKLSSDAERARLAEFLTVLVNRYRTSVKYWQLYNEMDNTNEAFDQQFDLGGCFGTANGSTPTQEGRDSYARTLEVAGAAIHAADPAAKVVSGAVVSGNFLNAACPTCLFDADFIKGVVASLKANNTLDRLDLVAVHFFSEQSAFFNPFGRDLLGRVNKLRQDMRDGGLSEDQLKPIVMDEGSFTVQPRAPSTSDPNHPFNQAQRNYIIKALTRSAAADLVAYFWFWLQDTSEGLGSDNAYGLIALDGARKPAYFALQYFQSLITRQDQFVGQIPTGTSKLEGYEFFTNEGRRLQILWNEVDTETISYTPPPGTLGSITNSTGTQLPAQAGGTVGIGAEPVFILSPICNPRPTVGISVVPTGGRLQVTLTANSTPAAPNNRLTSIVFGTGENALIDVPGGPTGSAGNITVPLSSVPSTTFSIRRANPNVNNALMRFTIIDTCSGTQTFVGGGPAAWAAAGPSAAGASEAEPAAPAPAPAAVDCTPRPVVEVISAPGAPGELRVTVKATGDGNSLQELRFSNTTNAQLDVGDQTGASGPLTVPLPAKTQQASFVVHRVTPNQPTTLSLGVVDGCGTWPTLVGGGPNAF